MLSWVSESDVRSTCSTLPLFTFQANEHFSLKGLRPIRVQCSIIELNTLFLGHLWDRLIVVNTLFNKLSQEVSHCPSLQRAGTVDSGRWAVVSGMTTVCRRSAVGSRSVSGVVTTGARNEQRTTNHELTAEPSLTAPGYRHGLSILKFSNNSVTLVLWQLCQLPP